MKRTQESEYKGILYVISSPIGNLDDITLRAIRTLKEVDYLFCEDTRVTSKLLSHYEIERTIDSYHDHSNAQKEDYIISLLKEGHTVGLISDCGTPIISDPGYEVVKKASDLNIKVTPIPGPSAQVAAITMAALPMKPYMFYGFLDHKESKKVKELKLLKDYPFTIVFYESPLRVHETVKDMYKVFGNRTCVLLREITKMFEERLEFSLSEYDDLPRDLKGEMVLVVSGKDESETEDTSIDPVKEVDRLIKDGVKLKDACKIVESMTSMNSKDIYSLYVREKK